MRIGMRGQVIDVEARNQRAIAERIGRREQRGLGQGLGRRDARRRDANQQLKDAVKDKAISEDDERRGEEEVQKLTDRYVAEIDKLLAQKEQELMQI